MTPSTSRALLPVALLAVAAVGCGELPTPPKGTDPTRPYRLAMRPEAIPLATVRDAAAGSPERALLTWFRAIQLGRLQTALSLYDPAVRPTLRELRRQRNAAEALLGQASFDRVVNVAGSGDTATVFALLVRRLRAPNGQTDHYTLPQGFAMRRAGDRWVLADNLFLSELERQGPRA